MPSAVQSVQAAGFEPLDECVGQFFALGGRLMVCAPCTEYYCGLPQKATRDLFEEAELAGLATVLAYVGEGGTAVSF